MTKEELYKIGVEVSELLKNRKFEIVGSSYGYAMSYGRDIASAIEEDFEEALKECHGKIEDSHALISVSNFESNEIGLVSLLECDFGLEHSTGILIELILGSKGNIYLEDISSYIGNLNS